MRTTIKQLASCFLALATLNNTWALTLTIPNNVLGKVTPGTPAGDADSEEQIRFLADKHNIPTAGGTDLGDNPVDPQSEVYTLVTQFGIQLSEDISLDFKSDSSNNSFNGLGTFEYVMGKFGSDSVIWYIGNLVQDGTFTLPEKYEEFQTITLPNGKTKQQTIFGGGLSHVSFYNEQIVEIQQTSVPDAGATAGLLGLALAGLALIRRKN